MKKIKCIIVDDEPLSRDIIKSFLAKIDYTELLAEFGSAEGLINEIKRLNPDVIFLDIEMPVLNGLDFARIYRLNIPVVFITAYSEFAIDAFEVEAVDYLLKPVSFKRFLECIEKVKNKVTQQIENTLNGIFLKVDGKLWNVNPQDITHVESMGDYLKVYSAIRNYVIHETMKSFFEHSLINDFIRIHRSYVVNINHIDYVEGNMVYLKNIIQPIPISSTYKKDLQERLS